MQRQPRNKMTEGVSEGGKFKCKATKTEGAYVLTSWFLIWNKAVEFILTFIEKRLSLKQRQIISLDSSKFTLKQVDFFMFKGDGFLEVGW